MRACMSVIVYEHISLIPPAVSLYSQFKSNFGSKTEQSIQIPETVECDSILNTFMRVTDQQEKN